MKNSRHENYLKLQSRNSLNYFASWMLLLAACLLVPSNTWAGTPGTAGAAGATGTVTGGNGLAGGPGGPGVIIPPGVSTNNTSYSGGTGGLGGAGGAVAGTAPLATGGNGAQGGNGGEGAIVPVNAGLTNNNILSGGAGGLGGAGGASSTTGAGALAIGGEGADGGNGGVGLTLATGASLSNTSSISGGAGLVGGAGGAAVSTTGVAVGGAGGLGGAGGAGVTVATSASLNNTGSISGGSGGTGGAGGAGVGAGGTGLGGAGGSAGGGGVAVTLGTSAIFTNSGIILGGNGSTTGGAGGAGDSNGVAGNSGLGGVAITGIGNDTVTESGVIQAGVGQIDAIEFSGGANTLVLESGYSITGNVVSSSGNTNGGDTLALGGPINASFDVAAIGSAAQYQGFTTYSKIGTSTWALLNTTAAVTPWTITQGTLSIATDGALGDASGILTLNGGTLETTATFSSTRGVTLDNGGGTFQVDPTVTTTLGANIVNGTGQTGALTKTGAGTLILTGANAYSGGTTVSAGTLQGNTSSLQGNILDNASVVFDQSGTGTYANVLSGAGSLTKQNTGSLLLTGANTYSGGTTINAGTVVVSNNSALGIGAVLVQDGTLQFAVSPLGRTLQVLTTYTQMADGTLSMSLYSNTAADQLNVSGTASIAGTLAVNFNGNLGGAPGTRQGTRDYTLLTSNNLLGTFTLAPTNEPATDTATLRYENNDVILGVVSAAVLFPGSGLDANEQATLGPINNGLTGSLNNPNFIQLDDALSTVYAANPAGFGAALDQLSPEKFEYFASQTAFNNASFETQAMDSYLAGQRGANGNFMAGSGGIDVSGLTMNDPNYDPSLAMVHSRLLAWNPSPFSNGPISDSINPLMAGIDTKDMKTMKEPAYNDPWNFFVRGNVILAQGFSQQDVSHFDDNTESVVLGTDYRINKNFLVGLTAGYAHTDVTLDTNGSSATVDSYSPGLYASYADHGWYANLSGQYLHNAYTQDRTISFLGQTAHSAPEGNQGVANLDGGYEFHRGAFTFGPIAGLQYTHLTVDGFTESGSAADLTVASNDSDSLRSRLGGTLRYAFNHQGMVVTPHLDATWQHEFLDQSRGITSQFGFGGGSFDVRTPHPSRDSALVDVGVTADLNRTVSVFTDYIAQAGQDNYFGQSIQAGVKIGF